MNAQRSAHSGRAALASAARVLAIGTVLVLVGYGGIEASAKHPGAPSTKAAVSAPIPVAASTGKYAESPPNEVSPNSLDAQNDPRECDATKGITDNCVFE